MPGFLEFRNAFSFLKINILSLFVNPAGSEGKEISYMSDISLVVITSVMKHALMLDKHEVYGYLEKGDPVIKYFKT